MHHDPIYRQNALSALCLSARATPPSRMASARRVCGILALMALMALMALAALAGCQRTEDDRTAGQKTDSAVAKMEGNAAEVTAEVKEAGREAGAAVGNAAQSVADTSRDAAITASVKTRLAADTALSARAINVDTNGGRVTLRATAPDTVAANRATELVHAVDGVSGVDNGLTLPSRP